MHSYIFHPVSTLVGEMMHILFVIYIVFFSRITADLLLSKKGSHL